MVYFHGGVYMDIDVEYKNDFKKHLVQHQDWKNVDLLLGWENTGDKQVSNFIFGAAPRHPCMRSVLEEILRAGEVSQALSNAGINDTLIMEVSAKSGQNVEEAISLLCNRIIDKIATTTGIENAATPAAEQGNAKKNKGGKLDGAEAISPNKIQNKGKLDELNEASDDDDDDDSASPKESNNAPKDTTPAVVSGGVTTRQVVSLKDVKKAEPLDTSMSSSVRSKKSNATYCPC
jgi:hypothetical protein